MLLPLLAVSETGGRIIMLGSGLANMPTMPQFEQQLLDIGGENLTASGFNEYSMSKLLDSMYACELQKILENHSNVAYHRIIVTVADPGMVKSSMVTRIDYSKCCSHKYVYSFLYF
jgi:NAD(P)-dependent dehydrogenase (short-subunit alcohol dehydrogenase family)